MIIDFHAHTFPDRLAASAVQNLESKAHTRAFSDGTRAGLIQAMQAAGIDRAVVLPVATNPLKCASVNDASLRAAGDGLIHFAAIHPDAPDWQEELARAKTLGFPGVKLHPYYQNTDMDDPRYLRILTRCGELGLIVTVHCGADIAYPGQVRCSPAMLRSALRQVGPVTVVAAHMGGWKNWQEVPDMLFDTSACLDTAYTLGAITPLDGHYSPEELPLLPDEAFCGMVRAFGSKRILFGTDSPWDDAAACVSRIRALPLTEAEKADILGLNARRLLDL